MSFPLLSPGLATEYSFYIETKAQGSKTLQPVSELSRTPAIRKASFPGVLDEPEQGCGRERGQAFRPPEHVSPQLCVCSSGSQLFDTSVPLE